MKLTDILAASLGILISVFLIYLTFSNIEINIFLNHLSKMNILYIPLFLFSTFFEIFFRTLKWYFILLPIVNVKITKLFKFEVIALGINNILPFRMGEISKMFLVAKNYNIPKTTVLSTVFVERLLDTIMLFLIFLIYSFAGGINIPFITKETGIIIISIIIIFIYIFFVYSERLIETERFQRFEKKHPKIHSIIMKIKNGGICFKSPKITTTILITGILQWNFDVLNNYIIAKSLSIHQLNLSRSAITVVAGSLSASIPSMPGYFGNYEYAISRVCMLWGIEKELATLFPAVVHILTYIILTLTAVLFIYMEGMSLKKLLTSQKGN